MKEIATFERPNRLISAETIERWDGVNLYTIVKTKLEQHEETMKYKIDKKGIIFATLTFMMILFASIKLSPIFIICFLLPFIIIILSIEEKEEMTSSSGKVNK